MKERKNKNIQSELKIAIVTDPLIKYEDSYVQIQNILKIFPQSEIFTPYYEQDIIDKYFPNLKIHDSFLQLIMPRDNKKEIWLKREKLVYSTFNFQNYDVVISISTRVARFIRAGKRYKHVGIVLKPKKLFKNGKLQQKSKKALMKMDGIITNSVSDKRKVRRIYGVNADVIYPPIEVCRFKPEKILHSKENWFLTNTDIGLRALKLVIKSCVKANTPLKIIGDITENFNPEELIKEFKARGLVKFLGKISEEEQIKLMQRCRAYIYPVKKRRFGRSVIEANAAGTAVIAYKWGAVIETISTDHPKTGIFFNRYNSSELSKILKSFNDKEFDSRNCIMKAQEFDSSIFMYKLKTYVEDILQNN
jgi:glycosyltransferase involved in cell wall biosynthesis